LRSTKLFSYNNQTDIPSKHFLLKQNIISAIFNQLLKFKNQKTTFRHAEKWFNI